LSLSCWAPFGYPTNAVVPVWFHAVANRSGLLSELLEQGREPFCLADQLRSDWRRWGLAMSTSEHPLVGHTFLATVREGNQMTFRSCQGNRRG
jgi:hypothetical protein